MPRASLTYHHIKHGGVPMTEAGARRFMDAAMKDGYSREEVIRYLKGEGMEQAVLSKGEFSMKEAVAIAEGSRNWCEAKIGRVLDRIKEIKKDNPDLKNDLPLKLVEDFVKDELKKCRATATELNPPKHYPKPEYPYCNAGHALVEIYDERRNVYDWDCPICKAKMEKASKESLCDKQPCNLEVKGGREEFPYYQGEQVRVVMHDKERSLIWIPSEQKEAWVKNVHLHREQSPSDIYREEAQK